MSLLHFLDDRLNPLLLRELRQLVRNRYVIVLINLFVAVLVAVCVCTVLFVDRPMDRAIGGRLFYGLTGIMGLACFLTVIVYTAVVTATERINDDLMFVSALKPSQIVLGKFFSGVILTFLLMSITFPFVTLAYLLRGLDFHVMLISFGMTFLFIQAMNSLAIFIFSGAKTYSQMFVGFAVAGFLSMYGTGALGSSLFFFIYRSYARTGGSDWTPILSMTLAQLGLLFFFLAAATATIAPPTANRLLPLRIVVTAVFLLSLPYCAWLFWGTFDIFHVWAGFWLFALIPLLALAVSERESWTYRIKKTIPDNFVLRMLVFPFYTGAPCGLVWVFLLGAFITLVVLSVGLHRASSAFGDFWMVPFDVLFAFNYCATALLLRSFLFPKLSSNKTVAIAAALLLLFTFGSMLIFYLVKSDLNFEEYSAHFLSALNPFLLANGSDQTVRLFAMSTWTIILLVPFLFWFGLRVREFTPSPPSDMMTFEDAVAAVEYADENPMVKGPGVRDSSLEKS